jgi:hypothetical protein
MPNYSKMVIALSARMRRLRSLPIAEVPEAIDADSSSTSADPGRDDYLQRSFPGVDADVLEEIDEKWQGDISDDVVDLLRIASDYIHRAREYPAP